MMSMMIRIFADVFLNFISLPMMMGMMISYAGNKRSNYGTCYPRVANQARIYLPVGKNK
jgi:hypothetical protein